jgi:hypothetical protein
MDALHLKQNGTLRIADAAGIVVEVTRGEVWLTQERDARDYFLRAGDWLRIDYASAVVISAMRGDAWVSLVPLDAEAGRAALAAVPA